MTENEMSELFTKYDDEFLKFERVEFKFSQRPDLHAFCLLDDLCPDDKDIIGHSAHDEITLSVDTAKVAEAAEEWHIRDLIRCGVRYSKSYECFEMFV